MAVSALILGPFFIMYVKWEIWKYKNISLLAYQLVNASCNDIFCFFKGNFRLQLHFKKFNMLTASHLPPGGPRIYQHQIYHRPHTCPQNNQIYVLQYSSTPITEVNQCKHIIYLKNSGDFHFSIPRKYFPQWHRHKSTVSHQRAGVFITNTL